MAYTSIFCHLGFIYCDKKIEAHSNAKRTNMENKFVGNVKVAVSIQKLKRFFSVVKLDFHLNF